MARPGAVVVWGNCQAAPLAELLRVPFAAAGFEVVDVPPVYLASRAELERVHRTVARAALLIGQPIREEYRFGGCGTASLAALLPGSGRLITIPTSFHTGPFPFLVNAHGADGARVDAPITDYHDLRTVVAASRSWGVQATLAWWPSPGTEAVRAVAANSLERLRVRETGLDVAVSDLVAAPDALWSMNHPTNRVLAAIAGRVLSVAGVEGPVSVPEREFLAERRAPVEMSVATALGWPPAAARPDWVVRDAVVRLDDVVAAHLRFYAARPDVVADTITRHADTIRLLLRPD